MLSLIGRDRRGNLVNKVANIIRRVVGSEFIYRNTLVGSNEFNVYKYKGT